MTRRQNGQLQKPSLKYCCHAYFTDLICVLDFFFPAWKGWAELWKEYMVHFSQGTFIALGICVAGSVGDAISVMNPDVYISDDGGYTWTMMLRGPHHYAILDSGGIIVAVEHTNLPIDVIKYAEVQFDCFFIVVGGCEEFIVDV